MNPWYYVKSKSIEALGTTFRRYIDFIVGSVSSHKVQDSLVLNPEAEQQLFEQRDMFDLVVLYDQNSPSATHMNLPIRYLKNAIHELEFAKYLPCMPMMLAGGFDAWVADIGPRGVYCFDDNDVAAKRQGAASKVVQGDPHIATGPARSNNPDSYYEKTELPAVNHDIYDYVSCATHSSNMPRSHLLYAISSIISSEVVIYSL